MDRPGAFRLQGANARRRFLVGHQCAGFLGLDDRLLVVGMHRTLGAAQRAAGVRRAGEFQATLWQVRWGDSPGADT